MGWFVVLQLAKGGVIHVRPDMVKAVYDVKPGVANVVVDGHDFEVVGDSHSVMHAVQYECNMEEA